MSEVPATYGFGVTLPIGYNEAITRVKGALKVEGFGVLTEIDVRQTLNEKLGTEMPPYIILGACNPHLAQRAIDQEPEIGLLLPCNVVVRAQGDGSRVEIVDPQAMLGIVGSAQLDAVASEAEQRLRRVVAALEREGAAKD
ncbi:MAG: hypothetical protein OJF49_001284 [Ktedonobacterales bacterium]|jgi:uncharacterized protein (DUF302 family)|nr:MAG: hypothetical protein OJF49_001284 [Ktedonobacterales bacterium]